jgi:hypothetical protein
MRRPGTEAGKAAKRDKQAKAPSVAKQIINARQKTPAACGEIEG